MSARPARRMAGTDCHLLARRQSFVLLFVFAERDFDERTPTHRLGRMAKWNTLIPLGNFGFPSPFAPIESLRPPRSPTLVGLGL